VTAPVASGWAPQGRELDHWDKATELVAIEDGQRSTRPIEQNLGPLGEPIEPVEAVRNAGNFPLSPTKARISTLLRNP
jgi:hypothetical protein